jgi:2-oxoglutarate ferredoxin oxidoreductase subunit alpha
VTTPDITIRLSGDAGQGLESSGAGFALAAARTGLHVLGTPDYRSRVRGGNNFFQVRLGNSPVYSQPHEINVLLALTADAVAMHAHSVMEGGVVLAPAEVAVDDSLLRARNITLIQPPLVDLAKQHGDRMMANTGALAALAALIGFPLQAIQDVIAKNFARKGAEAVAKNQAVADAAHKTVMKDAARVPWKVSIPAQPERRMAITGNQALALGALAGGCRYMSAYPMTPATTIIEWLSSLPPEYGMVTKHAEDEIAAICMAIGAAYTGARAMTATSGGGFCLMVEALGLAGMTEVPVVIVDAQRGGPSTGLPTRTEQGDLLFAVNAGHGEFPRIVIAPRTTEECFETGWRAFNLAERYQCPVIVLTDMLLAGSIGTIEPVDFGAVTIDRGRAIEPDEHPSGNGFRRFEFAPDGISPRAFPGDPEAVFASSSDEHDEVGHITEDSANRVRMMQKRMQKLETAAGEAKPPELYGPADAETTLLAWGSTYGPCREAVDLLNATSKHAANLLSFTDLYPFATSTEQILRDRRMVAVEGNYSSQLAQLLRMKTGISIDSSINRYDGRPFSPEEIAERVKEEQFAAV